jgi:hypothetical protein
MTLGIHLPVSSHHLGLSAAAVYLEQSHLGNMIRQFVENPVAMPKLRLCVSLCTGQEDCGSVGGAPCTPERCNDPT